MQRYHFVSFAARVREKNHQARDRNTPSPLQSGDFDGESGNPGPHRDLQIQLPQSGIDARVRAALRSNLPEPSARRLHNRKSLRLLAC